MEESPNYQQSDPFLIVIERASAIEQRVLATTKYIRGSYQFQFLKVSEIGNEDTMTASQDSHVDMNGTYDSNLELEEGNGFMAMDNEAQGDHDSPYEAIQNYGNEDWQISGDVLQDHLENNNIVNQMGQDFQENDITLSDLHAGQTDSIRKVQIDCQSLSGYEPSQIGSIIEALCEAQWWNLDSLDLRKCRIGNKEFINICRRSKWKNLRSLNLEHCNIQEASMKMLKFTDWQLDQTLTLSFNNIGNNGLSQLLNLKSIDPKVLKLQNCNISCQGLINLAKGMRELINLEELNLSQNQIDDKGMQALACLKLPNLKELSLTRNAIRCTGLNALRKVNWPFLEVLEVESNRIKSDGFHHLAEANLKKLKRLDISFNLMDWRITSGLVKANWPILETLRLNNSFEQPQYGFTVAGDLKQLRYLDLQGNFISSYQAKDILKAVKPLQESENFEIFY